jgi:diaminopimelate decarboxylase
METLVKKAHAMFETWTSELNIRDLYVQYGSPFWIVSKKQLSKNVNGFSFFTGHKGNILFPVKTNPSLALLEVLANLGVGADCANRQEIDLALFAGIPYERIAYNCPVQDVSLSMNLLNRGATVVMDDPAAIFDLQARLKGKTFPGKLWLRVNPLIDIRYEVTNENQELMSHASTSSKFGIPQEELVELVKKLKIPVSGLHVHVGTQMDNLISFRNSIKALHQIAQDLIELGHPVFHLDLGGGLGIPFQENDKFPSIGQWVNELNALKEDGFQYYVEPGHAICGNAVALMVMVETIKKSRNKRWILTNVGTDQLAKVTLLHWPHRILDADGRVLKTGGNDAVAGPLCFAGDTLLDNVNASHVQVGDPLVITNAGAYTFSLSNRFNGRTGPGWVLIDETGAHRRMNPEGRYDNNYLTNYNWDLREDLTAIEQISEESIKDLSSIYLTKWAEEDKFEYLRMARTGDRTFEVDVMTSSKVDFISMPFATRIFGDAAIIAILHHMKAQKKEYPIWGRKLNLDCFGLVKTGVPIRIKLSLSHVLSELNNGNTVIVRFETDCWNCSGTLVIKF